MIPHFDRQLIHILRVEIVPDVVVARTIVAGQLSRQRGKNPSRRELQESSVRDRIHATAPGVVDLSLQTMAESLHRGQLKTVVVTVLASGELRDRAESWIGRLHVGKWRKAALAHGLVTVHLRQIGLVHRPRADVLRLQTGRRSELMFNSQTPLHEVRRVQFAIGHCGHRDWWKTSCRICLWRCARKLALGKSRSEISDLQQWLRRQRCWALPARLPCSRHRVAARRSGLPRAKQPSLKRLDVGRIGADQVGNTARQNIAENPEASSKYGFRLKLPRNRCSRLQDCDWRGGEQIAEMSLNGGI